VRYKYYNKHSRSGLDWSRPRADRGLSRPRSVFRTKFYPDRMRFRSMGAKNLFLVKTEHNLNHLSLYLRTQYLL